ncbi:MAG: tRNA (adenosine(37)-N6)-threonylcarbamoyltransferase complex transferase subunit TsaD [Nanoarchaeota archaeon]|nr:tRNA (adenosine(37)-N6)-threonylcarbamoyltransferase complex transferase subunit TsaD [Nanoarchaeota archaeon]
MIVLGIESTAHTYGCSIIDTSKKKLACILSNIKQTYTTDKGGIIPIDAANYHKEIKNKLLEQALQEANVKIQDIELIAYSQAPGLAPCLKIGMEHAKELATKYKVPLIGVNHCIAHLEIGKLSCESKDPVFLFISGANTQVISYAAGKYRIFGETLDMGLGNFIDSFARIAKIGFPGGPKISELAEKGKHLIELPYSVKGMDVAFSGMLTNLKQKYESGKYNLNDLAYSLQEHAYAMVIEVSERALAHLKKNELIAIGGVASNNRFREMAEIMCKERNAKFYVPGKDVVVDNAAMIAYTGAIMYKADKKYGTSIKNADFLPYQRTDDVNVRWVK